jgi:hypothetical protein
MITRKAGYEIFWRTIGTILTLWKKLMAALYIMNPCFDLRRPSSTCIPEYKTHSRLACLVADYDRMTSWRRMPSVTENRNGRDPGIAATRLPCNTTTQADQRTMMALGTSI